MFGNLEGEISDLEEPRVPERLLNLENKIIYKVMLWPCIKCSFIVHLNTNTSFASTVPEKLPQL